MDRMEQAGGDAVMREAIREADRAIDQVKAELESTMARRLQAARQQKMLTERAEELTTQGQVRARRRARGSRGGGAVAPSRFRGAGQEARRRPAQAREEEQRLEDGLAALNARKRQMEDALQAYLISRREARSAATARPVPTARPRRRWTRPNRLLIAPWPGPAESASPAPTRDTINRVAEIDGMQKSATVAERLAALKAQQAA